MAIGMPSEIRDSWFLPLTIGDLSSLKTHLSETLETIKNVQVEEEKLSFALNTLEFVDGKPCICIPGSSLSGILRSIAEMDSGINRTIDSGCAFTPYLTSSGFSVYKNDLEFGYNIDPSVTVSLPIFTGIGSVGSSAISSVLILVEDPILAELRLKVRIKKLKKQERILKQIARILIALISHIIRSIVARYISSQNNLRRPLTAKLGGSQPAPILIKN